MAKAASKSKASSVSTVFDESLKKLQGLVDTINKPLVDPDDPRDNAGFILWWVTEEEALSVLAANTRRMINLPLYLERKLEAMTRGKPCFGLTVHPHPTASCDRRAIESFDIVPDTLREDAEDFPDAIMLPYSELDTVVGLAGKVSDMNGRTDLSMVARLNRQSPNESPVARLETFEGYLIWWLTDLEAFKILRAVNERHDTVPTYIVPSLSVVAHNFCGGLVDIPIYLSSAPFNVDSDTLDSLDPESPDMENMRDGILLLKSDLENIHYTGGIFTTVKGDLIQKEHLPALPQHNEDEFCIWFLTTDEANILNEGIRDGSVKLPGYLIKLVKELEGRKTFGDIVIPTHVNLDMARMVEIIPGENEEYNGIVIPRHDLTGVNKYCGRTVTLQLRNIEPPAVEFNKTPYTADEIRSMFLSHVKELITYWVGIHPHDSRQAAEGAVFSTLSTLDGSSMDLPGFLIVPIGTEEDNEWNASYGKRPYPVLSHELQEKAVDIGGELHSGLYRDTPPVLRSKSHITRKEWDDGLATQKWAFVCEVMLRDTQFVRDRFAASHPGTVLGDAWKDLCMICLKNGAMFIPDMWDWLADDYAFRWATDDAVVFDNMINDLSGYVLRTHF